MLAHTLNILDEVQIQETFDKTYTRLLHTAKRPVSATEKELAWQQILNYYRQNQQELQNIHAAEFPVQIDRTSYVLRGKIDLLVDGKKGLEVFDFKTQGRPAEDAERLAFYKQQLQLYAYARQRHTGQLPRRLWLYWTAEEQKTKALMEIPYCESEIEEAVSAVDELAEKIHQKRFNVQNPPTSVCKTCDIRRLCLKG